MTTVYLLPYFRTFAEIRNKKPFTPKNLNEKDKELLRKDIALAAGDLQLFDFRDMIDFSNHQYKRCGWEQQSKRSRTEGLLRWDDKEFERYTKEQKARQTW